ncbi:MAG: YqhA family protein [Hydrogenophaga sp.]|uniref:YqhA family protein n=1 Tax=Hydrogenophaga sp. TaxID=1904254 RepID=UPI003D9B3FBC
MEKILSGLGALLYRMRFTMLFFYVGLVGIIFGILGKFLLETWKLMNTLLFDELSKIDLIIKVLELVDMTMVAQLVWVVALAGVSLFVTTGHFDKSDMKKPDWLDHVNTYNLKLKLAFAIISISGVHALKTYLSGSLTLESVQMVTYIAIIHFTFVLSAIGISFAERLTREKAHQEH